MLFKGRYLCQSGISEWWRKYFDNAIVLNTTVEQKQINMMLERQNNTSVSRGFRSELAVICLIPGFGLFCSLVAFVVFDSILWKTVVPFIVKFLCLRKVCVLWFWKNIMLLFHPRTSNAVIVIRIRPGDYLP